MRTIPLTKGYVAIVDDEDLPALSQYKWQARDRRGDDLVYAWRTNGRKNGKKQYVGMHRHIMRVGPDQQIDHKNHNTLDNRKRNLRIVDVRGNAQNRRDQKLGPGIDDMRKYPSREWPQDRPFRARLFIRGKLYTVGNFPTPEAARAARAAYLKEHL